MPLYQTLQYLKANVMSVQDIPKCCYEIDAMIMDVFLVLAASGQATNRRPVLFTKIDALTGLIIDFSVQIA